MSARAEARRRVERLVEAARLIATPGSGLGQRARRELPETTGLSAQGVELALTECLESEPTEQELDELVGAAAPARRAHVLLPANVFVAAHRAIALALAASPEVFVRPSRREPCFARLLAEGAPGLFQIVDNLKPEPGDTLHAYGTEQTLESVRRELVLGVHLEAHGPGHGVAVVEQERATLGAARAIARDIVPFDQRGCLSPRVALFVGTVDAARTFAQAVAGALAELEARVPLGRLDAEERAEIARFRDTFAYAGELFPAGSGWVAIGPERAPRVAPDGRNLLILPSADPVRTLAGSAPEVTALGLAAGQKHEASLAATLPRARYSALGAMQRPRFDGPADRRGMA